MLDIIRWLLWGPLRKTIILVNPRHLFIIEKTLSFFTYHLLKERKRLISKELKKSFSGEWSSERIEKVVRATFRIYVSSQLRMFYLPGLNSSNIKECISINGLDFVRKELKKQKGVIILNPHFGPFMLIMPALSYRGYKVAQIALQGEPPWGKRKGIKKRVYEMKFKNIEGNIPVKFINAADGVFSLKEAFKVLKKNELLLFPSTGRGGKLWHPVKFMRRKALFPLFPFKMALKTGASLLPAFIFCDSKGKSEVKFEKPINLEDNNSPEELAEKYAEVLDFYIGRYPEHFLMYLYEVTKRTIQGQSPFFIE